MIEERKQFIYSTLKKCDGDSEAGNASNIEEYQRLSGKKLDFLDILLLTRVRFFWSAKLDLCCTAT